MDICCYSVKAIAIVEEDRLAKACRAAYEKQKERMQA